MKSSHVLTVAGAVLGVLWLGIAIVLTKLRRRGNGLRRHVAAAFYLLTLAVALRVGLGRATGDADLASAAAMTCAIVSGIVLIRGAVRSRRGL